MLKYFQIFVPESRTNIRRTLFKSLLIIGAGHIFFDNVEFSMNLNTPEFIQRIPLKHPITPPVILPHKYEEPELYDQYNQHWRKIIEIVQFNRLNLYMVKGDHPQLETQYIISDSYWIQESERVMEEAKNELKQIMKQNKSMPLDNQLHYINKFSIINSLNSKIKPQV